MSIRTGTRLTPASVAKSGKCGAEGMSGGTRRPATEPLSVGHALSLALDATDSARRHLDHYASATDCPAWEVVEAADMLDAACELLLQGRKP